jgi:hypothetical protein
MRRLVLATLALVALSTSARADEETTSKGRPVDKGTFGVGIIVGEPTGICAKLYLKDDQAIQAAAAMSFIGGGVQLHADYVFHPWILQDKESFVLPVYLGPGIRFIDYYGTMNAGSHVALGLRVVVGLLFDFKNVPLDAFLEVAGVPEYDFGTSKLGVTLNVAAGVRYYF